jgi:antirestriction protein ArdC
MNDIYLTVTEKIVASIEQGAGKFGMPWHSRQASTGLQLPHNVAGRAYRGVNVPILWVMAETRGYDTPVWGTYRQWQEHGAQVRKGEKATMVVFWKSVEKAHKSEDGDRGTERHLIARGYCVFNAGQVDGFDGLAPGKAGHNSEDLCEDRRIAAAEAFFAATGSVVRHGGNQACYTTRGDFIQMPHFAQFTDAHSYYAVLGHEHIHWSGAGSRLDRQFGERFGDQAYAFEELVAPS